MTCDWLALLFLILSVWVLLRGARERGRRLGLRGVHSCSLLPKIRRKGVCWRPDKAADYQAAPDTLPSVSAKKGERKKDEGRRRSFSQCIPFLLSQLDQPRAIASVIPISQLVSSHPAGQSERSEDRRSPARDGWLTHVIAVRRRATVDTRGAAAYSRIPPRSRAHQKRP